MIKKVTMNAKKVTMNAAAAVAAERTIKIHVKPPKSRREHVNAETGFF